MTLIVLGALRPSLPVATWREAALIGDFLSGAVAAISMPLVAVALILQATATRLQARAVRLNIKEVVSGRRQSREDQVISIVTSLVASRVSVTTTRMNLGHGEPQNRGRIEDLRRLEVTIAGLVEKVISEAEGREAIDRATAEALRAMNGST
ncbi:MAG: hypothetical protein IT431_09655 [Phycisphaerales bacterium]|nr:hypothetical protein [Phycisphaerales bacterium]